MREFLTVTFIAFSLAGAAVMSFSAPGADDVLVDVEDSECAEVCPMEDPADTGACKSC